MPAVDDQDTVQQFTADSSNPSFRDRVRPRCPHRRAQDTHTLASEPGIENAGELAVAIPDQQRELSRAVAEVHYKVACLLGNPGAAGVGGDSQKVNATGRVFHHEQHIQPLQQQRVDAEEVRGEYARGLYPQELPPAGPVAARGDRCRSASESTTRYSPQPGNQDRRVRHGCVDNPKKGSRRPAAVPTAAARVRCTGRRFEGFGAGATPLASLHQVPVPPHDRGRGDDPMQSTNGGQQPDQCRKPARSAHDSRGLLTWRRNTATSGRSTRISAFFDCAPRPAVPARP
jgi:hypothetical protein